MEESNIFGPLMKYPLKLLCIELKKKNTIKTDLPALLSISRHTLHEFCLRALSVVFHISSQPAWGRIKVVLFCWETWQLRMYLLDGRRTLVTNWKWKHFGTRSTAPQPDFFWTTALEVVLLQRGCTTTTTAHHSTPLAEKGLFYTNADAITQGDKTFDVLTVLLKTKVRTNPFF